MPVKHETPWERLCEAALSYADADSEDDGAWARAKDRLRKASLAYREECATERVLEELVAVIFGGPGRGAGLVH